MKGERLYKKALLQIQNESIIVSDVVNLLEKSLALGNVNSAYALGTWYLHGEHFKVNLKKALAYIQIAAKKNHPDACFDLAVCFEVGKGIKKNLNKAFEFYLKSALYGDKQAHYEVGRCYFYGIGIERNKRIANMWINKAKELGVQE